MDTEQPLVLMLDATLEAVGRATSQLHPLLPAGLPPHERHAVELGIAEVLTNIVRHGYLGQPGGSMRLTWNAHPQALEVNVFDGGLPIPEERLKQAGTGTFAFDPDDLASLPESGLGLALIKAAFDVVEYRQDNGLNHLRLVKNISTELSS